MNDKHKTALVFGGARGIGAAIVARLAADGYRVAFTYVSRPDKAEALVATLQAQGHEAMAIQADSADPTAIQAAVARAVARFGALDAAVVNAGVLRLGSIDAFSLQDLDLVLDVNVRGVYLSIQAAAAQMREGGRLVTIGSNTAERTGTAVGTVYAMSKAAVASMVKGVALDLAPRGITVNNVQPGPTETDMTSEMAEHLKPQVPLRRLGEPAEVAALVSYLCGPQSRFMTGASLTIDGGYVL